MPRVIYPAGIKILNTPIDSKAIPKIRNISSISFSIKVPRFLILFNLFLINPSPPYDPY